MSKLWPMVVLGDVLTKNNESVDLKSDETYCEVTIKLWGKGVILRRQATGAEMAASRRAIVRQNQFILSRIDARNGAFGLVPASLDGAVVSNDFPSFILHADRLEPAYLSWLSKTADFVELCKAASEGTTNRVRLKEETFLKTTIPLPPLAEQQRIVARIEELAAKSGEALRYRKEVRIQSDSLLLSAYHRIADSATRRPMIEVAPLDRRPVSVNIYMRYPQVSVRSFGKGSFHKPPLVGSEVTWQKPFLVKSDDILISNMQGVGRCFGCGITGR